MLLISCRSLRTIDFLIFSDISITSCIISNCESCRSFRSFSTAGFLADFSCFSISSISWMKMLMVAFIQAKVAPFESLLEVEFTLYRDVRWMTCCFYWGFCCEFLLPIIMDYWVLILLMTAVEFYRLGLRSMAGGSSTCSMLYRNYLTKIEDLLFSILASSALSIKASSRLSVSNQKKASFDLHSTSYTGYSILASTFDKQVYRRFSYQWNMSEEQGYPSSGYSRMWSRLSTTDVRDRNGDQSYSKMAILTYPDQVSEPYCGWILWISVREADFQPIRFILIDGAGLGRRVDKFEETIGGRFDVGYVGVRGEVLDFPLHEFREHVSSIWYWQYKLESQMGAECVRASPRPTKAGSSYSLENKFSPQKGKTNGPYEFEFMIENLCVPSTCNSVEEVVFEVEGKMRVPFRHEEMSMEGRLFIWKSPHRQKMTITFDEIRRLPLTIRVYSSTKHKFEKLSLKLDQLLRGPIHHDHMLPEMKSRLIFDIQISQSIQTRVSCHKLLLKDTCGRPLDHSKFYYSIHLLLASQSGSQALELTETKLNKLEEEGRIGNISLSNELSDSSIRIVFYEKQNLDKRQMSIFAEVYIPYQKIVSQCGSFKIENRGNLDFEKREICWQQELDQLGSKKGSVKFGIILETQEVYVEQLQCLISSEKGISAISPHFLKGLGATSSSIFKASNVLLSFKNLKQLVRKYKSLKTNRSVGNAQSRKLLEETYHALTTDSGMAFEDDQDDDIGLEQMQEILLDLLTEVGQLIVDGEDVINESVWNIFQTIFRRSELSIRCIHAIEDVNKQKKIGVKFYRFICFALQKIVRSTAVWITYHELKYTQKFVAYAYFRFPWLQRVFIKVIKKESDPTINIEKLTDMGVFQQSKSPSKNMIYDWQYALFSHIKNEPGYKEAFQQLEETVEMLPQWSKLLFNRDDEQFYYGSLIQILNQAELSLSYQGKIMWQYFPFYGQIIGSFLGQMNKSQFIDYSHLFKQFSVKLMLNEKLLNIFMLYLFPKTCLFQRSCVMKCLDLIKSCLDVVVDKKNRLPTDFNANYFYSGIVSILEFNHSYLSIRALWIVYIYYEIFSLQFQNSLDTYLLGKVFYSLFLHWCGHVRRIFMCLLVKKIVVKFKSLEKFPNKEVERPNQESLQEQLASRWRKYNQFQLILNEKAKEMRKEATTGIESCRMHEVMKAKLQEKKKRRLHRKDEIEQVEVKSFKKLSADIDPSQSAIFLSIHKTQDTRNRKWSVTCDEQSDMKIPQSSLKYLLKAMEEFGQVKASKDIDGMVDKVMELFQKKKTDF